jgi:hypothetical protein
MAASCLKLLTERLASGCGGSARLSLARTAKLLLQQPATPQPALRAEEASDQGLVLEQTTWGPANRLQVPLTISGTPLQWSLPAGELGAHRARW